MPRTVHVRVLRRAAEILGSTEALCRHLGVPSHLLHDWLGGIASVPTQVFLKAVDILAAGDMPAGHPAFNRALQYRRRTLEALAASAEAINESVRLRDLVSGKSRLWDPEFFASGDRRSMLEAGVDAALELTGADIGNIQLLHADGRLRIEAQRGFAPAFLDFFAAVEENAPCACGAAIARGERVIVSQVGSSSIFAGSPALRVMLDAGVQAVVSTPLRGRSGTALGMLSTHYRMPRMPSALDEHMLDLVTERTVRWLETSRP